MYWNILMSFIIALSPITTIIMYPVSVFLYVYLLYKGNSGDIIASIKKDRELCLLLMAVLISALFSSNILISTAACLILIIQVIFYVCVRRTAFPDKEKVINILLVTGGIVAAVGIMQYFFLDITMPSRWLDKNIYSAADYKRVFSTFINPNVLAGYLIFVISLSFSCLRRREALIVLPLSVLCLYFTFSRGGWLGASTAIIAVSLFKRDWSVLKVPIAIACGAIFLGGRQAVLNRAMGILHLKDTTFLYRLEIWKTGISLFRNNLLTGSGLGTAWWIIPEASPTINAPVGHAHNLYLQFAVETGIIGLVAFLIFYASRIIKALERSKGLDQAGKDLTIGLVGGLIGTAFHGIVDAVPVAPQLGIILWMFMGLLEV